MASRLVNRVYRVQWSDFQRQPPPNATEDAHIETTAKLNYGYSTGSYGARLADTVTVTIQLLGPKSWAKKQRIQSWPKQDRDDLLKHEQGHYDITALMGRDMFIDLMAIKSQTFSSLNALKTEVNKIGGQYAPQVIQDKYDAKQETNHGRNATQQKMWNGYFQAAITRQRSPVVRAPGAVYKVRLVDILKKAGKI